MAATAGPINPSRYYRSGHDKLSNSKLNMCDSELDAHLKITNYDDTVRRLDLYYGLVKRQLLHHQSITLGLFPENSLETKVADLRTSLYCATSIWSLYQAYRRIDDDRGKAYELGQSCVKCLRGILTCWMCQTESIEQFKKGQQPAYALHSKFDLITGEQVCSTEEYGHLQIDIVSLYLLTLVQITTSGLQVIYTMDEVTFVQNLVYYVERAYRTPDYGMWERGSKYNNGTPELHASSIGMAKAALEAINGCNLFGEKGASWSVMFVDIDAHNRNRSIFETLLPRESTSKNVDASLLTAISFPAFATHDQIIYSKTKAQVLCSLKGKCGFKRYLNDGYGTELEDKKRKYYHHGETTEFERIENEWPLFYIYLIIEGIFKENEEQVAEYYNLLKPLLKLDKFGDTVVPKYFYVSKENIPDEKMKPGSQPRIGSVEGSPRCLFFWGQALYIIASLLMDKLLHINELDLIRRYLPSYNRPRKGGRYSAFQGTASDLVVQVVLIAESMRLQAMMATYGIQTQTPHEVEPVQIWPPRELVKVYEHLGVNEKLGLCGRPPRPIGALGTSKIYRINGQTVLCYPLVFEVSDFYLSHDMALLIQNIKTELHFVGKYWRLSGRPTVCILIREEHMRDVHFRELLDLLAMLKTGHCEGLKVRTGRLQNLISSSCIEHLDFISSLDIELEGNAFSQLYHASIGYQSLTDIPRAIKYNDQKVDFKDMVDKPTTEVVDALRCTSSLQGRTQLLGIILRSEGQDYEIDGKNVLDHISTLLQSASSFRYWAVVRCCTALLSKEVESISPFITTVLVSGKQLTIGYGNNEIILDKPVQPAEIHNLFYTPLLQGDEVVQAVLQQEVVLYCGKLIGTNPELFHGILNIRIGWLIRGIQYYLKEVCLHEETVDAMAPNEVRSLVVKILSLGAWAKEEKLTPHQVRVINGCIGRTPNNFYDQVWNILEKSPGGIRISNRLFPQIPTIYEMSRTELNFAHSVQALLNAIALPEHRHVVGELLVIMSTILKRNPELKFVNEVSTDELINAGFKTYLKEMKQEWSADLGLSNFYNQTSKAITNYLARAVVNFVLSDDCKLEGGPTMCEVQ